MNQVVWAGLEKQSAQLTKNNKDKLASVINSEQMIQLMNSLPEGETKTAITNYVTASRQYVAMDIAYQSGLEVYMNTVKGSAKNKSGSAYLAVSGICQGT